LFPSIPALARRRFRFACLPVRGNVWLFRFLLRLRFSVSLFRQNGMAVVFSFVLFAAISISLIYKQLRNIRIIDIS
jgi:hypothetical protein